MACSYAPGGERTKLLANKTPLRFPMFCVGYSNACYIADAIIAELGAELSDLQLKGMQWKKINPLPDTISISIRHRV